MESKTESTPTKGFVQVYKSMPGVPFEPWFAPADAKIAYPYVAEEPDSNLKVPMYDWNNYRWIETDDATTGQQIADIKKWAKNINNDIDENNKNYDAVNKQIGSIVNLISALPVDDSANSAKEGSGK